MFENDFDFKDFSDNGEIFEQLSKHTDNEEQKTSPASLSEDGDDQIE